MAISGRLEESRLPLVSIATPCLNMARFLEDTIRSVLAQDYPRIEYLVMDGGSSDGTLAILERYKDRLRYVSAPDRGQAHAVNRGFALAQGSIFAFLNADDTYLPGAVSTAVRSLQAHPEAGGVYGEAYHVTETGETVARYPTYPFDPERLRRQCYICQPAAFLRSDVFREAGMLDTSLHFALDYDLWIRMARRRPLVKIDEFLATSRLHRDNKTLSQLKSAFRETFAVMRRHYGYVPCNWLYGYSSYLLTGKEPVTSAPRASLASLALCLALGSYYNKRHLLRYWKDLISSTAQTLACTPRP